MEMLDSSADWPVFASELMSSRFFKDGFLEFSLTRILKIRNLRVEFFAKKTRIIDFFFI